MIDEEHESSYKQYSQPPFYHARDVAVMRAKQAHAAAVLGSATPSLESYYNYRRGKYDLLSLRRRPDRALLPTVEIVDMKGEAERQGRRVMFSARLLEAMRENLEKKEQIILFLNRRGFFTVLACRDCGYVFRCPHCSVSLTFHKKIGNLVCHLCGYSIRPARRCPQCRKNNISYSGMGTQRIEDLIARFFPQARIVRMDTDAVGARNSHRDILSRFKAGRIDILVGTQMIAKGLDYPNVTLVGVIFADTALNLADFRATEHTFQILTQVAGRAGRGGLKGRVIVQTYSPRHPAVADAVRQKYEPFYRKEIKFRRELGYPPLNHFISITVLSRNEDKSRHVAAHIAKLLAPRLGEADEIMGPAPPPIERIRKRWRWQILIKTDNVVPSLRALEKILPTLGKDRDLKVEVDVDPISML